MSAELHCCSSLLKPAELTATWQVAQIPATVAHAAVAAAPAADLSNRFYHVWDLPLVASCCNGQLVLHVLFHERVWKLVWATVRKNNEP